MRPDCIGGKGHCPFPPNKQTISADNSYVYLLCYTSPNMKSSVKGFLALFATSFVYGVFGVVVRVLTPYLTANQMTVARSAIVALIIAALFVIKNRSNFRIEKKLIVPVIVHSVSFALAVYTFTYAVIVTTLTKAVFSLYSVTLILSLIVGLLYFKEKLGFKKNISFILAVLALIAFIFPTGIGSIDIGMALAGLAGFCDVLSNSMKKFLGGKVERFTLVFYQMIAALLIGLVFVFFSNELSLLKPLDFGAFMWLLFFSLNLFLLSYLTAYGFQHFDLNLGTIILSLEIVWASLAGILLFRESVSTHQIIASVLLLLSIVVMNLQNKNKTS